MSSLATGRAARAGARRVSCGNRELLQALQRGGADVDFQQHRARFPKAMTEEFVDGVRAEDKRQWATRIAGMGEDAKTVYRLCPL